MHCFLLAVNYFKHYNNYRTDQIISLNSAVQHLHYEIEQSFLRLCFMGGGVGEGVGEEKCLFLPKTAVIKLICCLVFELVYLTFITAATNLPILEGYFSVNERTNSKF